MSFDRHLGKQSLYPNAYAPDALVGIPRSDGRRGLGIEGRLPFSGVDVWNAYELSWLDLKGKPVVATAEFRIPATSPKIVESKSLKLYLNSLNGMRYESCDEVTRVIQADVQGTVESEVTCTLRCASDFDESTECVITGRCIDDQDVHIDGYDLNAQRLASGDHSGEEVEDTLCSHLLKSNCPVTGQPDWATLFIRYRGLRMDEAALLRYIVSYRNHDEFHEHCVERIFVDIKQHVKPRNLTVHALYTRRGGIDINPFRSDFEAWTSYGKQWRQ